MFLKAMILSENPLKSYEELRSYILGQCAFQQKIAVEYIEGILLSLAGIIKLSALLRMGEAYLSFQMIPELGYLAEKFIILTSPSILLYTRNASPRTFYDITVLATSDVNIS